MRRWLVAIVVSLSAVGVAPEASANGAARPPIDPVLVTTDNETPVLYDDLEGGSASGDDPAIWVHPHHSQQSVVIVTAKEGGLRVYDVADTELQSIPATPSPGPMASTDGTTTSTSPTASSSGAGRSTWPWCRIATTTSSGSG